MAAASWSALASLAAGSEDRKPASSKYLDAARRAAIWLRAGKRSVGDMAAWPADPNNPKSVSPDLYSGTAGVILFFLEMHHATGDVTFLADARAGANYLLWQLDDKKIVWESGLYSGAAGVGHVLDRVFKTTGAAQCRLGANKCVDLIKSQAFAVGNGAEWRGVTDVISGAAGIGLHLLQHGKEFQDQNAIDLASRAGKRLIRQGQAEQGGLKWQMDPAFPRSMPNFSHGTAGVAYFLATLYQATEDKAFLESALAGAKYLEAVANTEGDRCLIFHHEPGGQDLYYLGWCHGPVGTARLFYRLHQITKEERWLDWLMKCGRALLKSGIPEKSQPGYWNNVSQCCGTAGIAEFCLELHQISKHLAYLAFAERLAANLIERATPESGGLKWLQAEHRSKPKELVAQTGYMQGAAGVGMCLLRFDAFKRGKQSGNRLPDSPF